MLQNVNYERILYSIVYYYYQSAWRKYINGEDIDNWCDIKKYYIANAPRFNPTSNFINQTKVKLFGLRFTLK